MPTPPTQPDPAQPMSTPPLRFGTAGVRAPLGAGPDRMNEATVALVATAVANHLREQEPTGSTVIVGGDARHGSARFVDVAAAVLAEAGFVVVVPKGPVPTPVVAAAVASRGAAAGLMVTASHNPPGDNGIKVYGRGGAQIVPPTDAQIEAHLVAAAASPSAPTSRSEPTSRSGPTSPSAPTSPMTRSGVAQTRGDDDNATAAPRTAGGAKGGEVWVDETLVDDYIDAVVARIPRPARPPRVALTPVHGVGGEICRRVLAGIGVHDVAMVASQAEPDPDFPTVDSPNPERPQTTAALLELAARIGADVAIALDPDADRCAVGTAGPDGRWRMLDGDETGAVLADHLLREGVSGGSGGGAGSGGVGSGGSGWPGRDNSSAAPVVASTIVSSRLPSLIVPARGGRHVETLTGFKWLVRAGQPLRYAYEEAIGHCVLPDVVADKDGISAAAAWCAMVGSGGPTVGERLAALESEFGVHVRRNDTLPLGPGADVAATMARAADTLGAIGEVRILDGTRGFRVDVDGARAVVRPSGTEPLLKTYVEAWGAPGSASDAESEAVGSAGARDGGARKGSRAEAERRLDQLAGAVADAVAGAVAAAVTED